jgi:PAS domain S-box-containing protein
MLDEVIANPALDRYVTAFDTGHAVMVEGDDSQDLFILVSGELDILKGDKKIYEMTERGAIFGEMSFLLGTKRTATVKAKNDVKAIRIPKEEITAFLRDFPDVAGEVAKLLAKRLGEASQVIHGLKEFSDQLPDAVLLTDKGGQIISWNTAAKKLYGRNWDQTMDRSVGDIYEEPEAYKDFVDEVKKRYSVREKVLKIRHPEKGQRFVSTSTTLLYDGHHNFKGVLSLGRDVTAVQNLERRYRRIRNWLVPSFILLAVVTTTAFFGFPRLSNGLWTMDASKQELRNLLAKDYVLLKSLLSNHFAAGDAPKTSQLMKEFFNIQDAASMPYTGLVLLDKDKKVFNAYSRVSHHPDNIIGSSYAGIAFRGPEKSIHKVLGLYRTTEDHPMGSKGVEMAFELQWGNKLLGWLVFQMDVDKLAKTYKLDEEGLQRFHFEKS